MVSFDRYFENHDVPMIASDNFQGGYTGTKKLLELGCHHPVFIRFRSKFPGEADKRMEDISAPARSWGSSRIIWIR